jgi:hypothetical protein
MTISEFIQKLVDLGAPMEAALFAAREMEQKQNALDQEISTKRERWRRHKNNQRKKVSSGQSAGTSSGMSTPMSADSLPPAVYSNNIYPPSQNIIPLDKNARETRSLSFDLEFKEQFWPVWPNKVGKPAAAAAYVRARKRGNTLDQIIKGLTSYVNSKPPERPWLNPATFLNQDRFLDEPAKEAPQPARARERDLRNVPDYQLTNDEYWRKRIQLREGK